MTVENISWSISTKECCRPWRGLNPRPPGLQSDGASNWATEAGSAGVEPATSCLQSDGASQWATEAFCTICIRTVGWKNLSIQFVLIRCSSKGNKTGVPVQRILLWEFLGVLIMRPETQDSASPRTLFMHQSGPLPLIFECPEQGFEGKNCQNESQGKPWKGPYNLWQSSTYYCVGYSICKLQMAMPPLHL